MDYKIKEAFNHCYIDYLGLIKNKEVLYNYSYDNNNDSYYIRLVKGNGLFNTTVYMVQALKGKDKGYIKYEKVNKEFHSESRAIDYIAELITGVKDAEQG